MRKHPYKTVRGEPDADRKARLKIDGRWDAFLDACAAHEKAGLKPRSAYYRATADFLPHKTPETPEAPAAAPEHEVPAPDALPVADDSSLSYLADARWVYQNLGVTEEDSYTSPPPSPGAVHMLATVKRNEKIFFDKVWAPLMRLEVQARRGDAKTHDRNLHQALQRVVGIASGALQQARAQGEAEQPLVPVGVA